MRRYASYGGKEASQSDERAAFSPQPSALSSAYHSWQQRSLTCGPNTTFAEGLATGSGFAMPQRILWEHLDDFVLVEDDAILQAMVWMLEHAHTLAEAAGAAPLAAAYQLRERLAGRKVGLVCSGGNSSLAHLRRALARDKE
ncbi:MAG: pyridoxal-phosphate dependent enzyme [Oscillochloridaceae bacterium umkhey_bin13]